MSIALLDGAVAVVYPLVADLAAALVPFGGAAAAIVVCTVAVRLVLLPLSVAAVRGERRRAAVAPRVADLQRRHRGDPVRLEAEVAAAYRAAGTWPLGGCLPALAPAPVLMVWYRIFTASRVAGHANVLLSHQWLGVSLAARLFAPGAVVAFGPLLVVLAGLAVVAVRRARRVAAANGAPAPRGVAAALPFASLLGAAVVPLAAVVYLVVSAAWTAAESALLRRGLPARPAPGGAVSR